MQQFETERTIYYYDVKLKETQTWESNAICKFSLRNFFVSGNQRDTVAYEDERSMPRQLLKHAERVESTRDLIIAERKRRYMFAIDHSNAFIK